MLRIHAKKLGSLGILRAEFVGQVTKNISKAFPGRSAILPVVALVVVLCVMSGEARAGAILPLAQQPDPINFALPIDQSSSSGAPAEPASESNHDQQSNRKVARLVSIDGLAETGGASIPVNSAAGTAASAALAALDRRHSCSESILIHKL